MKKLIIIFLAIFLFSCTNNSAQHTENPKVETEKVENISENMEQISQKFSEIENRLSDRKITISLSSYFNSENEKNRSSATENAQTRENFTFESTKDFYENRNNFLYQNATIYALHLDDYRYDVTEMYTKEQMILVFEILRLYQNLDKNLEITVGNTDYLGDADFLLALNNLKVENLTLNGQRIFEK